MTKPLFRTALILKKHSPNIMFGGGVVGVVTSTVLACRATLKLPEALDAMQFELNDVNSTELVDKKDVAYVYAKNIAHIAKIYAPSFVVGALSISALTGSHVTLTKRNAGLTAAYAAVSKAYNEYRERVSNEFGEQKELELYHAATSEKIKNEDGKSEEVMIADPNKWSPYARFFDEYSVNWVKNAEHNRLFVQCQQTYANHLLHARGHVFLNEVYDMLGIERSSAGQVVGWVLNSQGDNYIDFGMFKAENSMFVNGGERSVLLDFNVDGVIYDKI